MKKAGESEIRNELLGGLFDNNDNDENLSDENEDE